MVVKERPEFPVVTFRLYLDNAVRVVISRLIQLLAFAVDISSCSFGSHFISSY